MLKFPKQITFVVIQNLKGIGNKKVLITSKLKKTIGILFQTRINLKPSFFHRKIKSLALSRINFAI